MQKNCWRIKCNHTPESLDRIIMPFRKRGMTVEAVSYKNEGGEKATCVVEFMEDPIKAELIYKNLMRTVDVVGIEKI